MSTYGTGTYGSGNYGAFDAVGVDGDVGRFTHFQDAIHTILAGLPKWWATEGANELAIILGVFAAQMDLLSAQAERIFANTSLATADATGLAVEYAFMWGIQNEQLPPTVNQLRAYLKARAAEDGSTTALINTLAALLGIVVVYSSLTFPLDGSGFTFPGDGSGLLFPGSTPDLQIIETPATRNWQVLVRHTLFFDRLAFARAVERYRPAHLLPATITEF